MWIEICISIIFQTHSWELPNRLVSLFPEWSTVLYVLRLSCYAFHGEKDLLCAAPVARRSSKAFSRKAAGERDFFYTWGSRGLPARSAAAPVARPSRAIGLLFSCWLRRVISCQGQGSSLDPDLFPTGATGPATWDIPDDLGPHGQFARSIPSRWALTAGLLATKSLDRSSRPRNPHRRSLFGLQRVFSLSLSFPSSFHSFHV